VFAEQKPDISAKLASISCFLCHILPEDMYRRDEEGQFQGMNVEIEDTKVTLQIRH